MPRLFRRKGRELLDRVVEVSLSARLVRVPPRQAVLNLVPSCFGSPGVPENLLRYAAATPMRLTVRRAFGGTTFPSFIANLRSLRNYELRAHLLPSCTESVVRLGSRVLARAYSWDASAVVICQLPTPALWATYNPVYKFFAKKLKYVDAPPYYPSTRLLDGLLREALTAEWYPVVYSACADGKELASCESEALVAVVDEQVSTVIYTFNATAVHPDARGAVELADRGVVSVGGEPTARTT